MKVAIIGAGNGGQTMAGHLSLEGYETWLYDIDRKKIEIINQLGGIQLTNAIEGFGKVKASLDIKEIVKNAEIIIFVATAMAHKSVAEKLLNIIEDGQIILIVPGYWGSIEFKNICIKNDIHKDIIVGEAEILPYATRIIEIGKVDVRGIKKEVAIAALPSSENPKLFEKIKQLYPSILTANSVLEVTLNNVNPIFHPAITIFNAGRIESKGNFFFYPDGVTSRVAEFIQKLDDERTEIGKSLGLKMSTSQELLKRWYNVDRESIYDGIQSNPAYKNGKAPSSLENSRYIYEDYCYGLVPLSEFAKMVGVNTPCMNSLIDITSLFIGRDLRSMGLTLKKLELDNMNADEIKEYCCG